MSPATAAALCCLAGGLAAESWNEPKASQTLSAVALLVGVGVLLSYSVTRVDIISSWVIAHFFDFHPAAPSRTSVATAACITALSSDTIGKATRRQLLLTMLPVLVGWLLLRAVQLGQMHTAAAFAVLIVLTIVPLALMILRDARMLTAFERERARHLVVQQNVQLELQDKLQRQARELTAQALEKANTEAALYRSQRLEAVGQLTGSIAHDFNNLLMTISGNLEIAARVLPANQRALPYLEKAKRAVTQGAKLTQKLLAFSRIQDLYVRPVELDPVLHNARSLIGNALGAKIDIQLDLQTDGLWTSTDPDQLELAILNLALNARDAMSEGGLLTIASRPVTDDRGVGNSGAGYISVTVVDTGTGMSEETAARATEPFFTTKETGRGSGLGLAQVDGLLRQCQGSVRIQSQLGKGTTIELLLRAATVDSPSPTSADEEIRWVRRKESTTRRGVILVIDDDPDVRQVIVEALRDTGYEVFEASDGHEGLNLLTRVAPDLAIVDFIMPGLNGAQVAARAQQLIPRLQVIFVSGYFDTAALKSIPGATVLRKPFNTSELQQAVAAALP
jgi:signal transduction histidine kinase/CheY-like chemotaxis protein